MLKYKKPNLKNTFLCISNFENFKFFPVTCGRLRLTNGEVNYSQSIVPGKYRMNTVTSFSCHSGYHLIGTNSTTCRSSEHWNKHNARCESFFLKFIILFFTNYFYLLQTGAHISLQHLFYM